MAIGPKYFHSVTQSSATFPICITGPESTGKSALAVELGALFDCAVVSEQAVEMLQGYDAYTAHDLDRIGLAQHNAQAQANQHTNKVVFDTDLSVLHIWSHFRFNAVSPKLNELWAQRQARFYLLCSPDLPWEPHPLRESPDSSERWQLFGMYRQLLFLHNCPFGVVSGMGPERLNAARTHLQTAGILPF